MKFSQHERAGGSYPYPEVSEYKTVQKFETPDGAVVIEDSYAWLKYHETDPEAARFVKSQNEYTDRHLEFIGTVEAIYERLEELSNSETKYSVPSIYRNSIIWMQRNPDQQQWTAMRLAHDTTEAEVVVDPNTLGEGLALIDMEYSPDEQSLIYLLQQSGDETPQVYIRSKDIDTDRHFHTGKIFNYFWDADSGGFTYTKSSHESYSSSDPSQYQKVYHHILESEGEDELIFNPTEHGLPASAWLDVQQSNDGIHTLVSVWLAKTDIRQYLINNSTKETIELLVGHPAAHRTRIIDGYIYLTTTLDANNKQILRTPIAEADAPADQWEVFLPERPDQQLQRLAFSSDYAIVEYTHNVASRVELRDRHTGDFIMNLDMPELSSLRELSASPDKEDFFYSISNCLTLETAYHFSQGNSTQMWQDNRSMDPERAQATQEWCELSDSSQQPMFVMAPKGGLRDQPRPVWLEGYGGFANGSYPKDCYNDLRRIWIEQGGIAIEPCLPGGDEFGDEWHKKAIGKERTVAFDGMITAIEHAINTGMTTPEQVALSGGSNGGLMATAVGMMRPDIIRVVNSRVPLIDMYDYPNHLIGNLWTPEFGNPRSPEEFEWLSYSPYHNFDPNTQYPSFFFTASGRDSRVHPVHAFKMTALMQSGKSVNPILLRTDADSGHSTSKSISHRLWLQAERLAFMMHEVGMRYRRNDSIESKN